MTNFDIPNEEELEPEVVYNYDLIPQDYNITENHVESTYNQFIQLRDTFIFSKKKYPGKAGKKLIVGDNGDGTDTGTIEVRENNISKMSFEPGYESHATDPNYLKPEIMGTYITSGASQTSNPLSCTINKDGRYRISHKEQFINLDSLGNTRVHCIVRQHHGNQTITRSAFDREWDEAGMFKRMTAYGYVECDLSKGDWLELLMMDENDNHIDSSYTQQYSNWWSVEYIDLAYNK